MWKWFYRSSTKGDVTSQLFDCHQIQKNQIPPYVKLPVIYIPGIAIVAIIYKNIV